MKKTEETAQEPAVKENSRRAGPSAGRMGEKDARPSVNEGPGEGNGWDIVTRGSWLAAVVLAMGIVGLLASPRSLPEIRTSDGPAVAAGPALSAAGDEGNFADYENIFRRRNIFEIGASRGPLGHEAGELSPVGVLPDLGARYRLVGLLVDGHPQIVIEDQTTQETKFLRPGDELEGAVLETIEDGRAVFNYHGGRIELKP